MIKFLENIFEQIRIDLQRYEKLCSRRYLRLGNAAFNIAYTPVAYVTDFRKFFSTELFILPAIA